MKSRSRILLLMLVVVVVFGVAAWYFFLRSDAPEKASLSDATKGVTNTSVDTKPVAGTWKVSASEGKSFGGYRVDEVLARFGKNTVVGRSKKVSGTLQLSDRSMTSVHIEVGMDQLQTDDDRRDGRARDALDTERFPIAVFDSSEAVAFDASPGKKVVVDVPGTFTIHGVKRPATVHLEGQRLGSTIVVAGASPVTFADYDVDLPSAPIVVSLEDHGMIEFQLSFVRS